MHQRKHGTLFWLLSIAVAALVAGSALSQAVAQPAATAASVAATSGTAKLLVVGTKEAPPFAMKQPDGSWTGAGIELWRRVAQKLDLHYQLQEADLQHLITGAADGTFDVSVAAITVTAAREQLVDFTQPFYATGLGIAVLKRDEIAWLPILRSLLTVGFAEAVLALVGVSLSVALIVWLAEQRHNEHFARSRSGLGSSIMWAAATMAQSSAGGREPMTLIGRCVAVLWLLASVVVIASFTAGITSQMTARQLEGLVHGEDDLRLVRVGAVAGTETVEILDHDHAKPQTYRTVMEGLQALKSGELDAFVYDRPLLAWVVKEKFYGSLKVLDTIFDPQVYAIALPHGSQIRVPLNVALLEEVRGDWWRETLNRYIGKN